VKKIEEMTLKELNLLNFAKNAEKEFYIEKQGDNG
tara:strand:- start:616 stop:720 length:105 start_codon:yes stop_codon:yes gene_type:complete